MAFGDDEEILQDFLVEAGEIIEQLSEQLVDLEQRPNDKDLLNAIFRGFHTVKGGAGFLQLNEMVECCHVTENLFDILRNGQREVTSELMDVVLLALDTVTNQFSQLQQGDHPSSASSELIQCLEKLVRGDDITQDLDNLPLDSNKTTIADSSSSPLLASGASKSDAQKTDDAMDITDSEFEDFLDAIGDEFDRVTPEPAEPPISPPELAVSDTPPSDTPSSVNNDISEDEFEALLDSLHGQGKGPSQNTAIVKGPTPTTDASVSVSGDGSNKTTLSPRPETGSDDITDEEFEHLLDQLHGEGRGPTNQAAQHTPSSPEPEHTPSAPVKPVEPSSDDITDDEFEALLDQLHGKGKGPSLGASDSSTKTAGESKASTSRESTSGESTSGERTSRESTSGEKLQGSVASSEVQPSDVSQNRLRSSQQSQSGAKIVAAPPGIQSNPPSHLTAEKKGRDLGSVNAPQADTTVRVDTQRLDDIMNMVGELVLVRNRLVRLGLETSDEPMQKAVANLDVVTADLQTAVMKTRMQPIKKVFGRFPRVVRDLARNLKKEISLELVGEDTDLDKNLVEALADPLVHLVRNSVDHGIELPAIREQNDKPRTGKILLSAEQEGDHILLSISDDGGGMDPDQLRKKSVEKGMFDTDSAARLNDNEAFNLIFAPGFSTKQEISDVSGRGVGMDVVKTKINQLNGSIQIESKVGQGTRIIIKVPLTLAIMPTLMIMLSEQTFALPLVSVNEIFHMDLTKSNIVDGQECITIRDKAVPIFHLKKWLIQGQDQINKPTEGHVVIVSVGTQRVGFVVDQLIGQEEVVIKPLGKMLQGTPGMAGATITGDGTIALILDVPSMLNRYAGC